MKKKLAGIRVGLYRKWLTLLLERWILARFVSEERHEAGRNWNSKGKLPPPANEVRRVWFHAASVGELESLWTVVTALATERGARAPLELILTVWSDSAKAALQKLSEEIKSTRARILYSGFSPWEGHWNEALGLARPSVFVTAKYEAWPELWLSLGAERIPLVIVAARPRRSLRIGKFLCRVLGGILPEMILLPVGRDEETSLRRMFPKAKVQAVGDARWDRVAKRASAGNRRARELISTLARLPRPWGVLGSVWPEDMALWKQELRKFAGSIWIVPHKIDEDHLSPLETQLRKAGLTFVRSTEVAEGASSAKVVLVNEMGFLSELYSEADWAYIGGGLGAGVHSTIEPAIHGIALACGPNGAGRFYEIGQLVQSGQLEVVRSPHELKAWLHDTVRIDLEIRDRWRRESKERLGATDKVAFQILGAGAAGLSPSDAHANL